MTARTDLTTADWTARARALTIETRLFVDGGFVSAGGDASFEVINPATGAVVANVSCGGEQDVDQAVARAMAAWNDGRWRHLSPRVRMDIFRRFADLVEANAADLALLDCLSMGKPITDALTVDVPETVVTIRYFGECIDKIAGTVTNSAHDAIHTVMREPIGVVGAISAWNYPLLMATWKIAPALAAGNCVVLKPAERAPLSCLRLAALFMEAGGPEGVFNVVNGYGHDAGRALALHPDVAKISFTGSTGVGKQLMIYAGQSNLKRVSLETGGKSPQIFMPDLADLDTAVDAAVRGIFDNAGQVCNAGSRLIVHEDLHEAFVEAFTRRAGELYRAGDPLDPATTLGPMVSRAQQAAVLQWVQVGRAEGAHVSFGGGDVADLPNGAFVAPTLFTEVRPEMSVAQEEIFGPVAAVLRVRTESEAIQVANHSRYGLAASVWTQDVSRAHRMIKALEAGVVWVNCFGDGDMTQPFGGYKQSGNTRDKSMECLAGYLQSKSAWINIG